MELLENIFEERLANRPYCSDNLNYGLQIRDKCVAEKKRYIQANQPHFLNWLCFDIDYPSVLETTFREKLLPTPNFVIENKVNKHAHLLYGLKTPVCLSDNARVEPINYARAVEFSLKEELKADNSYGGLIIKNPLNDNWKSYSLEKDLWSLDELSEFLVLPNNLPKKSYNYGLGRNCFLFEQARKYAYKQVLLYKISYNEENFYSNILTYVQYLNSQFENPLVLNECLSISKSVSKWTWRNYKKMKSEAEWKDYVAKTHTSEIQSLRGKRNTSEQQSIKGKKGGKANTSEQQSIKGKKSAMIRFENSITKNKPWESMGISRATWYRKNKKENLIHIGNIN
jgi:hypothetical protein